MVLVVKNPLASSEDIRDTRSIPGLGRSAGVGNGNLLQYSCLENSMDKGAWWTTVHKITGSQTRLKRPSAHARCCWLVAQLCPTLCDSMDCSPPGAYPWHFPDRNTGVGCHFLPQGIFLTQGLNLHLLHWQVDSLPLSHRGSPLLYGNTKVALK